MPRKVGDGVQKCFDAIDRIMEGRCINILNPLSTITITPSLVAQEAGFVAGYIKPKRKQHLPIIERITALNERRSSGQKNHQDKSKYQKDNALDKAERNTQRWKEKYILAKSRLDASLSREMLLLETIQELTHELETKRAVSAEVKGDSH